MEERGEGWDMNEILENGDGRGTKFLLYAMDFWTLRVGIWKSKLDGISGRIEKLGWGYVWLFAVFMND